MHGTPLCEGAVANGLACVMLSVSNLFAGKTTANAAQCSTAKHGRANREQDDMAMESHRGVSHQRTKGYSLCGLRPAAARNTFAACCRRRVGL